MNHTLNQKGMNDEANFEWECGKESPGQLKLMYSIERERYQRMRNGTSSSTLPKTFPMRNLRRNLAGTYHHPQHCLVFTTCLIRRKAANEKEEGAAS